MNFTTTAGATAPHKPLAAGLQVSVAATLARTAQRLLVAPPLLLWLLVAAAALMAFFIHLLNEQMVRGQLLREEQRAAATRPAPRVASVQHPVNMLVATRQPMTRP